MALVKSRDGKTQLVDNTDAVVLELATAQAAVTVTAPITAASVTVSTGTKSGYATAGQADAIALAVKKIVTALKAAKILT